MQPRDKSKFVEWFLSQAIEDNDCWIWINGCYAYGYGHSFYAGEHYLTHVLSYLLFVGDVPQGLFVCHSCDNPPCYNPEHLFLGHNVDNIRDSIEKGRRRGTIITEPLVRRMVSLANDGLGYTSISKETGVHSSAVYKILNGYAWSHITGIVKKDPQNK